MKIRFLKKAEVPQAVAMARANYGDKYSWAACRRELLAAFDKTEPILPKYLVAEDDKRIVGTAGYMESWMDENVYLIFWVNVRPNRQRQGIGKTLVSRAITEIRKKKKAKLILLSTTSPLYYRKQFGFKTVQIFAGDKRHLMSLKA